MKSFICSTQNVNRIKFSTKYCELFGKHQERVSSFLLLLWFVRSAAAEIQRKVKETN